MLIPILLGLRLAATAPASDSVVYTVYNHDRPAGTMILWRWGDSARVRYDFIDRNRGTHIESRYHIVGDDAVGIEIRNILPNGTSSDPSTRLELFADSVRRWTPARTTTIKAEPGAFYTLSFTPWDQIRSVQRLLRQPNQSTKLPGNATAHLEIVRELTVSTARGKERVRLASLSTQPGSGVAQLVWLDSKNELFSTSVSWFMTVRSGAEPALPTLRKAEAEFRDAEAERINERLLKPSGAGVIAIKDGDLFDSERGVIRPHTTVVVRDDRIVAVGPADSVPIPSGATIIEAAGKTIMPGMWDMHGHMQAESEALGGPTQLSFGITTVRDLGSDPDIAVANRDRAAAGKIAAPREILSGFIDGPEAWAGPTPNIVHNEAEARAFVAHFDSLGYKQIKLYNLVHPDLVPTFAAEAHKRGMRLSGHIPRGLSVPAAIELGFDEVNHAAFLFSTFYQDSLYIPTMRAYSLVATIVAPHIDVDGAPMTALIDDLVKHHTVIDGTFAVWVTSANTGIAQAVGAGASSDAEKSDANYMRLLKRLYDAGVTLVPGTDAFGSTTFDAELELYERAGIPAPAVLQIATIVAARVMKDDHDFGSISVGKVADLFIINGNPAAHISDVRKVEQVIRAGHLYDSHELRTITGLAR